MSSYAMNLLRTGKLKGKFPQHSAQQSAQTDIKFKHKRLHLVIRNGELLCLCNAQALPIVDGINYDTMKLQDKLQLQTKVREYLIKNNDYIINKAKELVK